MLMVMISHFISMTKLEVPKGHEYCLFHVKTRYICYNENVVRIGSLNLTNRAARSGYTHLDKKEENFQKTFKMVLCLKGGAVESEKESSFEDEDKALIAKLLRQQVVSAKTERKKRYHTTFALFEIASERNDVRTRQ